MTLNLADTFNPTPKPSFGRNKPLARTRGAITPKVRKELLARSQGACERCKRQGVPLQAAHLIRRWQLDLTTSSVLAHLCLPCHLHCDNTAEGRDWLTAFQTKLQEEAQ